MIIDTLHEFAQKLETHRDIWIAYSGGVDSHVLLHGMKQIEQTYGLSVRAVHIQHNLQPEAPRWTHHCKTVCQSLDVPFVSDNVEVAYKKGESLEEKAREARYAKLKTLLPAQHVLMTAHHGDDQMETLLLRIQRGTGVHGLCGLLPWRQFGKGYLARPLLPVTRADIIDDARKNQLDWVSDPSNQDQRFDRNYLRHQVIPLLKKRWPAGHRQWVRLAKNSLDTVELLDRWLDEALSYVQIESNRIDIDLLAQYSSLEQIQLLRHWFRSSGKQVPSRDQTERIQNEVLASRWDATPYLKIGKYVIRRHRNRLYRLPLLPKTTLKSVYHWDMNQSLVLPHGRLYAEKTQGKGLRPPQADERVTVRFRQGGERCQLPGESLTRDLKKLFQQWHIPPWHRWRIPLIYYNNQLAAIVGYTVCAPFITNHNGFRVTFYSSEEKLYEDN